MTGILNVDQISNSAGSGAVSFPNGYNSAGAVALGSTLSVTGVSTFTGGIATSSFVAPTVQKFTSGSGTYTTPTSPRVPVYIRVRLVGGGGGGAGSGSSFGTSYNGTSGGTTSFGTTLLSANGGSAGINDQATGAGGTATLNSLTTGFAVQGGTGQAGLQVGSSVAVSGEGGMGAASPFGGAGGGGGTNGGGNVTVPGSGIANTGSGGGGGGTVQSPGSAVYTGGGGCAGGYIDAIIPAPTTSYLYVVGAGGAAGTSSTNGSVGGAGGSGYIIVEEIYQ